MREKLQERDSERERHRPVRRCLATAEAEPGSEPRPPAWAARTPHHRSGHLLASPPPSNVHEQEAGLGRAMTLPKQQLHMLDPGGHLVTFTELPPGEHPCGSTRGPSPLSHQPSSQQELHHGFPPPTAGTQTGSTYVTVCFSQILQEMSHPKFLKEMIGLVIPVRFRMKPFLHYCVMLIQRQTPYSP